MLGSDDDAGVALHRDRDARRGLLLPPAQLWMGGALPDQPLRRRHLHHRPHPPILRHVPDDDLHGGRAMGLRPEGDRLALSHLLVPDRSTRHPCIRVRLCRARRERRRRGATKRRQLRRRLRGRHRRVRVEYRSHPQAQGPPRASHLAAHQAVAPLTHVAHLQTVGGAGCDQLRRGRAIQVPRLGPLCRPSLCMRVDIAVGPILRPSASDVVGLLRPLLGQAGLHGSGRRQMGHVCDQQQ